MSIFEYDEEAHMKMVRAEGMEQGRAEGEWKKLISQVQKKLEKGMTTDAIADILEEKPALIEKVIEVLQEHSEDPEEELLAIVMNNVNI